MPASELPDFADELLTAVAGLDAPRVDTPLIQPAEPFLDMAGEDLRRRIYLTENERGDSLCLRPEFTIPVCIAHIARQETTPRRYSYLGQVFRQRREGGNEFYQSGIEDLGETDTASADARSIAEAFTLIGQLLPDQNLSVVMGDQAVFEAVVAGLGLPPGWQTRLIHAFGDTQSLEAMIAALSAPQDTAIGKGDIRELVAAGDLATLSEHIGAAMDEMGFSTHASRAPDEIAARLIDKTRLDNTRLSDAALAALKAFLALESPLVEAAVRLQGFADQTGLDIAPALGHFAKRVEKLKALGVDVSTMGWQATFGRPLDYYTGLVFEISGGPDGAVLAGGGRYDRMLTLLGAKEPIPAVGFSFWIDRIEAARSGR